jgi:hypothetical protein
MTRAERHRQFVDRFSDGRPKVAVSDSEFERAEAALGMRFPFTYQSFITTYGPVFTPDVLDAVVDNGRGMDVAEFFAPLICVETTDDYRLAGMPYWLVAFARDCMGNVFCFERDEFDADRPDDATVWFFDHDFCEASIASESFDTWLTSFLDLR